MRPPKRGTASAGPARPRMSPHRQTAQGKATSRQHHGKLPAVRLSLQPKRHRPAIQAMNPYRYSDSEIAAVYRVIRERRDMRHFRPDPLDPALLERLLQAAHLAPSVGFMQPWRFIRLTDRSLRTQVHALVDAERQRTALALGERQDEFMRLKVEGILDCGEVLVAALMDGRERHIFGRRTMPDMDLASVACAIQNLWLAARAEGIGVGWVSLFDPEQLGRLLRLPSGARPVAVLCLGQVDTFYEKPMLEQEGWARRQTLDEMVFENGWTNPSPPIAGADD